MPNLVIATEYISPTQNSTGYIWSNIINMCYQSGLEPTVVSPSNKHVYETFSGNTSLPFKFFKQIRISLLLTIKALLHSRRNSVLLTGTNPLALLCLIPFVVYLRNNTWILLVHDVFPENLVAAGLIQETSLLFRLLTFLFNRIYSSADVLICIGRDMKRVIDSKTCMPHKSVFLPNWVVESDVFPLEKDCSSLGFSKDQIVFQFFGNIGRVQGIDNILAAITLVTAPNAAFVFFGAGALLDYLKDFIASHPSLNLMYGGHIPLTDKNVALSMCDISLVTLDPKMLGLGVPSKAYFSLAAGRPILASVDSDSELGYLLREHPVGWRCDPGQPQQLATIIDRLCSQPNTIYDMNPRSVFLQHYSHKIVLHQLVDLVSSVLASTR
jgi:glycosyltransferase involved in cell wall biosynthesis